LHLVNCAHVAYSMHTTLNLHSAIQLNPAPERLRVWADDGNFKLIATAVSLWTCNP
jgi:hypothetical protein